MESEHWFSLMQDNTDQVQQTLDIFMCQNIKLVEMSQGIVVPQLKKHQPLAIPLTWLKLDSVLNRRKSIN